MRKKLPILLLTIVFLLQAFIPAVYAASKNEAVASSASFCQFDTSSEGAGNAGSVGAAKRLIYEASPKHVATAKGSISAAPRNGQEALNANNYE